MSEQAEQIRVVDEALLADAVQLLKARGERVTQLACLQLPPPLFGELCLRILGAASNGGTGIAGVAEWLAGQTAEAPSQRAVYRFADYLREAYREAKTIALRGKARAYTERLAEGDPQVMTQLMNNRTVELITDQLLDVDSLAEVEDKRLFALLSGVRLTSQNVMDREKTNARLKALETAIEKAEKDIALKQRTLDAIPARVKAVEAKLNALREQARSGKEILPAVYEAIFGELAGLRARATEGVAA